MIKEPPTPSVPMACCVPFRRSFGFTGFAFVQRLGVGVEGTVHLVRSPHGALSALKVLRRGLDTVSVELLADEVAALQRLAAGGGSVHVVRPFALLVSPRYFAIQMEFVAGGTLATFMARRGPRLGEDLARYFIRQVLIALAFCHARRVAFRDLKPENCILDHGSPPLLKLVDFGVSRQFRKHEGKCQTFVGTPGFMSPGVLNVAFAPAGAGYDAVSSDIWAAGALLHLMLTNTHPFGFDEAWAQDGIAASAKLRRVWMTATNEPIAKFLPQGLSTLAVQALEQMLGADERCTPGALACLDMPWMTLPLPPNLERAAEAAVVKQRALEAEAPRRPFVRLGASKTSPGEWRDTAVREFVSQVSRHGVQGSAMSTLHL